MATVTHAQAPLVRRSNALGVHSLHRFVFTVPDLAPAEAFYRAFGLDVRREGNRLDLYAHGHPHCWGSVYANGEPKRLQYLSFAAYDGRFRRRSRSACAKPAPPTPHPLSDGRGVVDARCRRHADPGHRRAQGVAGGQVAGHAGRAAAARQGRRTCAQHGRSRCSRGACRMCCCSRPTCRGRWRSTSACWACACPTAPRDIIAFLHGPHASDHHLVAFAKSGAPGLHHSSWDVGHFNDVGLGAERMKASGYTHGWGVGRHVLGSNYFYYVQDPWGSWAEYSYDIDFVPADLDWPAADHPPEDSFYIWGPSVPEDFIVNHEQPRTA